MTDIPEKTLSESTLRAIDEIEARYGSQARLFEEAAHSLGVELDEGQLRERLAKQKRSNELGSDQSEG